MFSKERPLPKALNIIRPSPPPFINTQDSSSTASSPSEISTISNISTFSNSRPPPTLFNPTSLFQHNVNNFKTSSVNTVGVNPHRFLQRPRSNSSLSRSTFFTAFSDNHHPISAPIEDDLEYDDLDSIDGMTDDEEDDANKVVAKIKNGTIMNGKGELVSKGNQHDPWSDEARANRKIADLEIENQTLLLLNATLETKLRQQTLQISELEKKLQRVEAPLTPISDKHVENENEQNELVLLHNLIEQDDTEAEKSFQRIKSALEGLIEQAEVALIEESKQSGKVIHPQDYVKETPKRSSTRRTSDSSATRSVKITRNPSRQSSPPILQHPTSPPIQSRRSATPIRRSTTPIRRSTTPSIEQRPSSRLSSTRKQEAEKPKWSF